MSVLKLNDGSLLSLFQKPFNVFGRAYCDHVCSVFFLCSGFRSSLSHLLCFIVYENYHLYVVQLTLQCHGRGPYADRIYV